VALTGSNACCLCGDVTLAAEPLLSGRATSERRAGKPGRRALRPPPRGPRRPGKRMLTAASSERQGLAGAAGASGGMHGPAASGRPVTRAGHEAGSRDAKIAAAG